jgi:hypothetical protein
VSYATIAKCANDYELSPRVTAALAAEGSTQPQVEVGNFMWPLSAKSDIEAAYASALAANNPHPGGDETVVTDGMILSAVQSLMPAP